MKKIFLLYFMCSIFWGFSQNNRIIITYETIYHSTKESDKKSSELLNLEILPTEQKSYFYSLSKIKQDSIYMKINATNDEEYKKELLDTVPKQNFDFIIEKKYTTLENFITEKFNTYYYQYSQKSNLKWKILNEIKMILNQQCRKAITYLGGREWEVWYSEELPIADGPYKFRGLPGVILEAKSTDGEYVFRSIAIYSTDKQTVVLPKRKIVKLKDFQEVLKYKRNYAKSPSALSRQQDISDGIKGAIVNGKEISMEESYRIIDEETWNWMKEYNNPIEKNDIWVK